MWRMVPKHPSACDLRHLFLATGKQGLLGVLAMMYTYGFQRVAL